MFVTFAKRRKSNRKFFDTREDSFFFEMFGFYDLLDPKEKNGYLHTVCQKSFWTLKKCSLTFVMCYSK